MRRFRRWLLESGFLLLLAYLIGNVGLIAFNPAQHVTQTTTFLGKPRGDLSEQVRLRFAQEARNGVITSNVTWETYPEICGFTWAWKSVGGAPAKYFNQADGLCDIDYSVDYYAQEGVNTLTPAGINGECGEVPKEGWSTHRFCDGSLLTQHIFPVNLTELGLPGDTSLVDVAELLYVNGQSGIYENENWDFVCGELEDGLYSHCNLKINFYGDISFEVRNSTVTVTSQILEELGTLVGRDDLLPYSLSAGGMQDGICREVAPEDVRVDCSIVCSPAYPYPSSDCGGTYEVLTVEAQIPNARTIMLIMLVGVVTFFVVVSNMSMGMASPGGRTSRGYLGPGGACRGYFEGMLSTDDIEDPSRLLVAVVPFPAREEVVDYIEVPVARHGTSLTESDEEDVFRRLQLEDNESHSLALQDESSGGDHLKWARGFSLIHAGGCVLSLWTVHVVASHSGWGQFYWVAALVAYARWLEESDLANLYGSFKVGLFERSVPTTPKMRASSAPPLPLTLAAMEVLYELSVPHVELIGFWVTAAWTLVIFVSCARFVSLLGYESFDGGGGTYANKVSVELAGAVGYALGAPFALVGDWVRRPDGQVFRFYPGRV